VSARPGWPRKSWRRPGSGAIRPAGWSRPRPPGRSWSRADAGAIEVASHAYAELGAYLPAAEAAITAAQLLQSSGRRTAAAAAGARAAVLRERCAGCHTAPLDGAARPSPLTARELQIARLAAGGSSNREIAEGLGISVRTADTHLQRAYDKLGVADRSALALVLETQWSAALKREGSWPGR